MKTERVGIIAMFLIFPVLIFTTGIASDDERDEYEGREDRDGYEEREEDDVQEYLDPRRQGRLRSYAPSVNPARNLAYLGNCADCHLAYSPNMLPARSWEKLMANDQLQDHFGDYVSLEEADRREILGYLTANSAERSGSKLAQKILRRIGANETPIRIRDLREIAREHDEIPERYITGNAKVLSLSQCNACHQQADKGVFKDDDVFIPYEKLVKK